MRAQASDARSAAVLDELAERAARRAGAREQGPSAVLARAGRARAQRHASARWRSRSTRRSARASTACRARRATLLALVALADKPYATHVFARAAQRSEPPARRADRAARAGPACSAAARRLACYHDRIRRVAVAGSRPKSARARLAELAESLGSSARAREARMRPSARASGTRRATRSARSRPTSRRATGARGALVHARRSSTTRARSSCCGDQRDDALAAR